MEHDEIPIGRAKDIRGNKIGHLTVLYRVSPPPLLQKQGTYWKCRCDCGETTITRASNLKTGKTISCGCSTESHGELKIKQLLLDNNLHFQQEYWLKDCRDAKPLRFDFYINRLYFIEFDGRQHFEPVDYFGGKERFELQQKRDQIKNEYCLSHNIPLIRIPYWHYDKITIEDLQPETSQFLIKGEQQC